MAMKVIYGIQFMNDPRDGIKQLSTILYEDREDALYVLKRMDPHFHGEIVEHHLMTKES